MTACPGCGRTTSTVFQELAQSIERHLDARMAVWRAERPGVAELKVAVMGCIVNGPGESRAADIGISLPGTGESAARPGLRGRREGRAPSRAPSLADDFIRDGRGLRRGALPARRGGRARAPVRAGDDRVQGAVEVVGHGAVGALQAAHR